MYELEKFTVDGLTVRIIHDDDAQNPRKEWGHVGTMFCWHGRYALGDEQPSHHPSELFLRLMQEREQEVRGTWPPDDIDPSHVSRYIDKHFYVLPLYLHDHSGLSMSTSSFGDSWDSGGVGYIVMSKDKAEQEGITDPLGLLRSEVAEYDQYLSGDVWGYEITDADGHFLDSCWGFYGSDHCEEQATDSAKAIASRLAADFAI